MAAPDCKWCAQGAKIPGLVQIRQARLQGIRHRTVVKKEAPQQRQFATSFGHAYVMLNFSILPAVGAHACMMTGSCLRFETKHFRNFQHPFILIEKTFCACFFAVLSRSGARLSCLDQTTCRGHAMVFFCFLFWFFFAFSRRSFFVCWPLMDRACAFASFHRHIQRLRNQETPRKPL